jgi:hypothetical protein
LRSLNNIFSNSKHHINLASQAAYISALKDGVLSRN